MTEFKTQPTEFRQEFLAAKKAFFAALDKLAEEKYRIGRIMAAENLGKPADYYAKAVWKSETDNPEAVFNHQMKSALCVIGSDIRLMENIWAIIEAGNCSEWTNKVDAGKRIRSVLLESTIFDLDAWYQERYKVKTPAPKEFRDAYDSMNARMERLLELTYGEDFRKYFREPRRSVGEDSFGR